MSLGLTLLPNSLDLHQTQNKKMKSWTDPAASFHFPETVQVFSISTSITKSSMNHEWSQTPGVTKGNLGFTSPPHSRDQHHNHKSWMARCFPCTPGF